MDISLFRGRFTRLNKRLRQEAQNHPETWSQMLVMCPARLSAVSVPGSSGP